VGCVKVAVVIRVLLKIRANLMEETLGL